MHFNRLPGSEMPQNFQIITIIMKLSNGHIAPSFKWWGGMWAFYVKTINSVGSLVAGMFSLWVIYLRFVVFGGRGTIYTTVHTQYKV